MPRQTSTLDLPCSLDTLFAFFQRPANLVALALPELHLTLAEGPDLLQQGVLLTWKARRWGLTQTMQTEITALAANRHIVEEQRQGPLRSWRHERQFSTLGGGARLVESIDYEPPGGMLGLLVTADRIAQELEAAFLYRGRQLLQLFSG